jgi:diguanylate cyclase (GGDEF)-like protein
MKRVLLLILIAFIILFAAAGCSLDSSSVDYYKNLAQQRLVIISVAAGLMFVISGAGVFLFLKNIKLGKKLKQAANHDILTGIFNRRYFMEISAILVEKTRRKVDSESFIIICDLDFFKRVNDTYGHLAGDKVLKETAAKVKNTIRPYDIFARYGGEEFILLFTDIDKERAVQTAERIRAEICKEPVMFKNEAITVSASFGVAYASPVNDLLTAIEYADAALYKAKADGRNRVVFYE